LNHIGNDIVDLKTPEAKGKAADTRFIKRVLNLNEQRLVCNSDHPDTLVWALWAAKESAYKAASKSDPDVSSAPGRYPVILDSGAISHSVTGLVGTPLGSVPIKINFHDDYVHCIGIYGPANYLKSIISGISQINSGTIPDKAESISENESSAVRRLAKMEIASYLYLKKQDIDIIRYKIKNKLTPPIVSAKGKTKNMEISLSHDGRFAAYAFLADSSK